jgi:DNA-binding NarL/FixJ family response regulator
MTEKRIISVLIADDHALVRRGLVHILSLYPEFKVVADVENGREAITSVNTLSPDIVIMDLNMPEINGIEATRQIKKDNPKTKIIVVSAYDEVSYVLQVHHCGANAYMLKSAPPDELRKAMNSVMDSPHFYCPHIPDEQLQKLIRNFVTDVQSTQSLIDRLTTREREILQYIALAKSHHEIADILHISVRTVDTHHNNILNKLGLHDSVSLVTFAIKNGIIVLPK